ncbi:MAG: FixH family protein [Planctomycetota bacterium]
MCVTGSRRARVREQRGAGVSRTILLALALFSLLLGVAGCAPPAPSESHPSVRLVHALEPSPPMVGPTRLRLELLEDPATPLAGASIRLEANMNHAGMVPVFAEAQAAGGGRYVADFQFTMGGDWFVLIDIELADGRTLQRRLDVPHVRSS